MCKKITNPILFVIAMLFATVTFAQEIVVLDKSNSMRLVHQCSRESPKGVTDSWVVDSVTANRIAETLANITVLETSEGVSIHSIDLYSFQLGGLVQNGEKVVYINAVKTTAWKRLKKKNSAVIACDGGFLFWGVIFHPADGTYRNLAINGLI